MYMILQFLPFNTVYHPGDFVISIHNEDGSIKLFDSVWEANEYLKGKIDSDMMRIVSIEGEK